MSEWTIYLWTRVDSVYFTVGLFCWVFLFGMIAATIITAIKKNDGDDVSWKPIIRLWIFMVSLGMLSCAIPTSKDYAMMKVIPQLANSEISQQIQKDMPEIYTMAKDALKEMIAPKKVTK